MGAYQPAAAHGYMPYKDHDDCGCDGDHQPYFSATGRFREWELMEALICHMAQLT